MLPLDNLSEAATRALVEHGLSPDEMSVALQLDLDFDGNFGESWLIYCQSTHSLIRLLADADSIPKASSTKHHHHTHEDYDHFGQIPPAKYVVYHDEYSFTYFSDMIVDTLMSSNRFLLLKHDTPRPDTTGMDHDKTEETLAEWNKDAVTEIAAYCTNSKRQRLFAFREIVERLERGDTVTEDDQIFEQFNARCPKCGRVYEDQDRKICSHCTNQSAVFVRLMRYFKPFRFQLATVLLCMLATSAISLLNPNP